jgi:hypothetical protein
MSQEFANDRSGPRTHLIAGYPTYQRRRTVRLTETLSTRWMDAHVFLGSYRRVLLGCLAIKLQLRQFDRWVVPVRSSFPPRPQRSAGSCQPVPHGKFVLTDRWRNL